MRPKDHETSSNHPQPQQDHRLLHHPPFLHDSILSHNLRTCSESCDVTASTASVMPWYDPSTSKSTIGPCASDFGDDALQISSAKLNPAFGVY